LDIVEKVFNTANMFPLLAGQEVPQFAESQRQMKEIATP